MSEDEWFATAYPNAMLEFLYGRASGRKLRLLACHCCHLPPVRRLLQGADHLVAAAERYADGRASMDDLARAADSTPGGRVSGGSWRSHNPVRLPPSSQAQRAALSLANEDAWEAAWGVMREATNLLGSAPCDLMRDIFGNHFRPTVANPTWFTEDVVGLADGIYADRGFDRLPILSDALRDAGCDIPQILDNCRGEEPHVRGCWVIDLLLGRE